MATDTAPTGTPNVIEHAMATGTLGALWAHLQPDVDAVVAPGGTRTFRQLNARANQVGRLLRAAGIGPGDSVALLCANRPEYVEVLQGAQRCGVRLTPVNWHLTADEIAYVLTDCGARALFADARFADVAADAVSAGAAQVRLAIGGSIPGFDGYDEAVGAHDDGDLPDPVLGTTMLYTSGTTGRPKGVHRDPAQVSAGALSLMARLPEASAFQAGRDVSLVTGPLYHAAPLAFALGLPLAYGVTVVLMDDWDAEEALRLVERHRVTHTHMVPTMFSRLLRLPELVRRRYDVSSLKLVWHGAAPCPVPVKQSLLDWLGPVVWEYYGATEGLTTIVAPADWQARPGTVGRPDDDQIRILDGNGDLMPPGVTGTIYIKAPEEGRFAYYGDEEKTSTAYRGDYYTLGDVGYLDEDGWLFLTDRSVDLIISGGVNIYPAEVEAALVQHPAVADIAVIGVPNAEWGEEVKAVVEVRPEYAALDGIADDMIAFARERLAAYKCPRSVDVVDRLPRADSGKLYKRRLRDAYRAALSPTTMTSGAADSRSINVTVRHA
jgi:long-chain acyl-CoA synthetase